MAQLHQHNPPRLVDADGEANTGSHHDVSAELAALDPDAAAALPQTVHEGRMHRSVLWRPRRWMQHAACQHMDTELFFAGNHQPDAAKRVCERCSVPPQCAEFALRDETLVGVWGGLTIRERPEIRTERHRQRDPAG